MDRIQDSLKSDKKEINPNKKNLQPHKYEFEEVLMHFDEFIKDCRRCKSQKDKDLLWKAFHFANKSFEGIKKNSSEYYIEHSIEVTKIVTNEIGLGMKSAISALLHDVVDETDMQIDDIKHNFGVKIASILSGLAKIREVLDSQNVVQAESFRKILLTLSDDIRVIFIKIADRLYHMRTINSYSKKRQLKTVTESLYVYVPLAQRLGLYNIKTELEDLCLKYKHPEIYDEISGKILGTEKERTQFITNFSLPIIKSLSLQNVEFDIDGRTKSIFSIWSKMQKKHVRFDKVYDLFAIRIVFEPSSPEKETEECWKIYSAIAQLYPPKTDRIRDWVTTPKPNGYEALHVTVLGPKARWVEVQIRSRRMNELAEIGFAAHWKYKGITDKKSELDHWISEIKSKLSDTNESKLDFFDSFKLNIFSSEILVFTPKGKIINLPKDSTVLDFAFEIHSDIAYQCIGAKIGRSVVPLNHKLSSGDIIEVLDSAGQKPSKEWYNFVGTTKAKKGLNKIFKAERIQNIREGKKMLNYLISKNNVLVDSKVISNILKHYQLPGKKELYFQIGNGKINKKDLSGVLKEKATDRLIKYWKFQFSDTDMIKGWKNNNSGFDVDELKLQTFVDIAKCCNPVPGDNISGCEMKNGKIRIHRSDCKTLKNVSGTYCQNIIQAQWTPREIVSHLKRIELHGSDEAGIANKITSIISANLEINIKSMHFDTQKNKFYGLIDFYVANKEVPVTLVEKIKQVDGVLDVKLVHVRKNPLKDSLV
ncbi:MAG: RelA/SpoT family protein [Bacteroidota bacterium]